MSLYSAVAPLPVNRIKNRLFDPDARDYILRVEAADEQRLESQVRGAINSFVIGCKADGIWTPLVGSCIMAGARTFAGALVPLRGNAPTNNNFVAGDYSRTLGLLGDASTKFISTNYNNLAFAQNDAHISCYVTQAATISATLARMFIGQATGTGGRLWMFSNTSGNLNIKNRSNPTAGATITGEGVTTGFKGHSREPIGQFTTIRSSQTNTISSLSSTTLVSAGISVFNNGASAQYSDARMSFYSLGASIDLALLDSRITTLMNTLARVIT
jgi:hypothetical protein